METFQGKWDTEVLRYRLPCALKKKEKYYTEMNNTITIFNDNNNMPLSNVKI